MFCQNFSKLNQLGGVAAAYFSSRHLKNVEKEKKFLSLEIAEIDKGINFGSGRTILDIKVYSF